MKIKFTNHIKSERGVTPVLVLVAIVGVVTFLLLASTGDFKDKLFNYLYPKPTSNASEELKSIPINIPKDTSPKFAEDRVIVQYKVGVSEEGKNNSRGKHNLTNKSHIRKADKSHGDLELESLAAGQSVEESVSKLKQDPNVVFAEPDFLAEPTYTANDTYYYSQWHMHGTNTTPYANQYGSQAAVAWANGLIGNKTTYVAIIDTGVNYNHVDLASNMFTNPFDPVDGIDNDGNGLVDDYRGWDFYSNDNDPIDETYHGTGMAGIIGAVGGNGQGVAGVNWNIKMVPLKHSSPAGGGYYSAIIPALDYITDLKVRHNLNIVASNNSYACVGNCYSQAFNDAIIRAAKQNILFVAAAGNSSLNNDVSSVYPANFTTINGTSTETSPGYEAVISVAAIDSAGLLPSWSDYGAATVDLGAPGSDVTTTTIDGWYGSGSGTSNAAPHVVGAAALYASTHPGATAQEIRSAILGSVISTPSLVGKTVTGGRLNIVTLMGITSSPTPSPSPTPTPTPSPIPSPSPSEKILPTVYITSPANGASVSRNFSITISANATDNVAVAKVEFYVNNSVKCTDTVSPYSCTTKVGGKPGATHSISAKAYDSSGNTASSSITVTAK